MAYYWFAKNIPELQDVAVADRREWLRMAEERSSSKLDTTVLRVLLPLAVFVGVVSSNRWHLGTLLVVACFLCAFVADRLLNVYRQARARKWLREHLHEFRVDDPPMAGARL